MKMQKNRSIFSLIIFCSSKVKSVSEIDEISVKHFMPSILVWAGTMKLFRIISMRFVSNIYPRGIHEIKAWRVLRQDLTKEGLITWGLLMYWTRTQLQSSKIAPKSLTIEALSYLAWEASKVFFEKSKTSSDKSFKILSAFSHLD